MTARRQEIVPFRRPTRVLAGTLSVVWMIALGVGFGARGAVAQYNSPVGKGANTAIPPKAALDEAYEDARWNLGPVRVQPWIGLRDASFVTVQTPNADGTVDETDDFTATAGAGFRAYARTSPKLVMAVHALPEYTWWQDDDAKTLVNGRYGVGLFGFFNRLKLEASARRVERQDLFSTEVQQLTTLEEDITRLGAEVELARGINLWAMASSTDYGNNEDDLALFRALNRTEDETAVGLRLTSKRGYRVGVGFKDLEADFDPQSKNLSNDGSAVLLELGYETESGRVQVLGDFEWVELEPTAGSIMEPFDDVIGKAEVVWEPNRHLAFLLYEHRDLSYSVSAAYSHVLSGRTGITARLKGGRSSFDLTYAVGEDEFEARGGGLDRSDDVTEVRASVRIPVGDLVSFTLYGNSLDYDSADDEFDRDFTTYGMAVDLGRIVERLSLGDSEGVW